MAREGRDARGRFTRGNKASVGNKGCRPRRAVEERYLAVLSQQISLEEWAQIVRTAKGQALQGDDKARSWLGNYLIGKPTDYVAADVTSEGESLLAALRGIQEELAGDGDADPDADQQ